MVLPDIFWAQPREKHIAPFQSVQDQKAPWQTARMSVLHPNAHAPKEAILKYAFQRKKIFLANLPGTTIIRSAIDKI
jgi:hypothetical protein